MLVSTVQSAQRVIDDTTFDQARFDALKRRVAENRRERNALMAQIREK